MSAAVIETPIRMLSCSRPQAHIFRERLDYCASLGGVGGGAWRGGGVVSGERVKVRGDLLVVFVLRSGAPARVTLPSSPNPL